MSPESVATISTSLVDLDTTFLPVAQMRQITRVTAWDELHIAAEVELGADHWVYAQHLPEDPIFPGTLMIEAAGQLVALWAWMRGLRGRPRLVRTSATFLAPVGVAAPRLELHAEVRGKRHLQFGTVELRAQEQHVATVEIVLAVLPAAHRPPSTST